MRERARAGEKGLRQRAKDWQRVKEGEDEGQGLMEGGETLDLYVKGKKSKGSRD